MLTVPVEGMTCGGCVASVTRALQRLEGVASASVTLAPSEARVTYDPGKVTVAALVKAIEAAGFEVPATWAGRPAVG